MPFEGTPKVWLWIPEPATGKKGHGMSLRVKELFTTNACKARKQFAVLPSPAPQSQIPQSYAAECCLPGFRKVGHEESKQQRCLLHGLSLMHTACATIRSAACTHTHTHTHTLPLSLSLSLSLSLPLSPSSQTYMMLCMYM